MKCRQCGMRKSWAQAVAPTATAAASPASTPVQPAAKTINANIEQVFAKITQMPKPMDLTEARAPLALPMDKASLNASIKALEAALHHLPPESTHDATRAHLIERISAEKRLIMKAKPLGAQLDSCKAALERAQRRREQAQEAMDLAKATLESAGVEVQRLQSELNELESTVAMQPQGGNHGATYANSIEGMVASLQKVLEEMKTSRTVPVEYILETETKMTALLTGVQRIADYAKQQAAAAAATTIKAEPQARPTPNARTLSRSLTDPPEPGAAPIRCTRLAAKTRHGTTPYGIPAEHPAAPQEGRGQVEPAAPNGQVPAHAAGA